jgi:hypothetical protein
MKKVSWEVRCDIHGKAEVKRPINEKVVKVGVPLKDPKHMPGCPICLKEKLKKSN